VLRMLYKIDVNKTLIVFPPEAVDYKSLAHLSGAFKDKAVPVPGGLPVPEPTVYLSFKHFLYPDM